MALEVVVGCIVHLAEACMERSLGTPRVCSVPRALQVVVSLSCTYVFRLTTTKLVQIFEQQPTPLDRNQNQYIVNLQSFTFKHRVN